MGQVYSIPAFQSENNWTVFDISLTQEEQEI